MLIFDIFHIELESLISWTIIFRKKCLIFNIFLDFWSQLHAQIKMKSDSWMFVNI